MIGRRGIGALLLAALVPLAGCSSRQRVLMPARLDLRGLGTIGMVDFTPASAGDMGSRASREFLAAVHSAQPGVAVLELGDRQRVLASVGHQAMDAAAVRAIGQHHNVDMLVVGTLDAQRVTPSFRLGRNAESVSAGAAIEGALTVRIFDTRSGATVWTAASRASEPLAGIRLAGGELAGLGARDPVGAEERLVRGLVYRATGDMRPYWVRQ